MSTHQWEGGEYEERQSEYGVSLPPLPKRFHCKVCGATMIRIAGAVIDDETGLVRRKEIAPDMEEVLFEVECINGHRWWTRSRHWVRKPQKGPSEKPTFTRGAPLFDNQWDTEDSIVE